MPSPSDLKPFDPQNADNVNRANRASRVLELYKRDELKEAGEVTETDIQDLFTDLLHLAHREGTDDQGRNDLITSAIENFEAETNGTET